LVSNTEDSATIREETERSKKVSPIMTCRPPRMLASTLLWIFTYIYKKKKNAEEEEIDRELVTSAYLKVRNYQKKKKNRGKQAHHITTYKRNAAKTDILHYY
jgi:hypothetical protein